MFKAGSTPIKICAEYDARRKILCVRGNFRKCGRDNAPKNLFHIQRTRSRLSRFSDEHQRICAASSSRCGRFFLFLPHECFSTLTPHQVTYIDQWVNNVWIKEKVCSFYCFVRFTKTEKRRKKETLLDQGSVQREKIWRWRSPVEYIGCRWK